MTIVSAAVSKTGTPPSLHQTPRLPILTIPPAPAIPARIHPYAPPRRECRHRNDEPPVLRNNVRHQKINLCRRVRNRPSIRTSLRIHHVPAILHRTRRLHLHPPKMLP